MADPMWKQIAEDLRQKIESGRLGRDGKPLPTELELQAEYNASRNTIRDAIKWLVTRNLVYTRSGQGTFVTERIDPFVTILPTKVSAEDEGRIDSESAAYASEVRGRRRSSEVSVPRVEIQQASGSPASELQLDEGTSVLSRHQRRFIDGVPWSLQTTFYPMSLVTRGAEMLLRAEDIWPGAVAYIEQTLGIKQVGWRDRFIVRVPDATESVFFRLPDDGRIAVIEIIRTGYDASGQPFRVTVTTYPADRNQFVIITGDVPDEPSALASGAPTGNDETGKNESQGLKN
jgi:GntR family transcriptional regulator